MAQKARKNVADVFSATVSYDTSEKATVTELVLTKKYREVLRVTLCGSSGTYTVFGRDGGSAVLHGDTLIVKPAVWGGDTILCLKGWVMPGMLFRLQGEKQWRPASWERENWWQSAFLNPSLFCQKGNWYSYLSSKNGYAVVCWAGKHRRSPVLLYDNSPYLVKGLLIFVKKDEVKNERGMSNQLPVNLNGVNCTIEILPLK